MSAINETDYEAPSLEFIGGELPAWMQQRLMQVFPTAGTPRLAFEAMIEKLSLSTKTKEGLVCHGSIISKAGIAWSYWAIEITPEVRQRLDRLAKRLKMPYTMMTGPVRTYPWIISIFAPENMRQALHENAPSN